MLSLPYFILLILPLSILIGGGLILYFERRLIALAQKRLGISFLGRGGWAHLPSDVVKFWLKKSIRLTPYSGFGLLGLLGVLILWGTLAHIFFLNGYDVSILYMWDYSSLALIAYSNISTLLTLSVVLSSKSKYATIASQRFIIINILLEFILSCLFLFSALRSGSFTIESQMHTNLSLMFSSPMLGFFFFVLLLFEAKRAPFDHTEAESELVAGHLIEFGGRSLLIFFICEYIHVYVCIFLITVFVFNGFQHSPFLSYVVFVNVA